MLSGQEIQQALAKFVARWSAYRGTERAEAQTFLNELFAAYGSDRADSGARFEDFVASAGFMDLHLPGVLIVEMKAPGVPLSKAADQRERYWRESSDDEAGTPAARWVVACNFGEFEVWEPGRFPNSPRARFTLAELPDRYDALLFLQAESSEPVFSEHRRALTTEAARHVAALYTSMADRAAAPVDEIQRFTMQLVWCLFAEDLGMLDGYPLQKTVDELLKQSDPDSARDIGYLFQILNQKGDHNRKGRYSGTRYVNGELFARPAAVVMDRAELQHLRAAAEFDWRAVDPTIFGSLLEGVLGEERRERLGAHYTHESDILKIVVPTIVRPWRDRIDAVETVSGGVALLGELCAFRVLDPACGCGNFLYVSYRELRALEWSLKQRIREIAARTGVPAPVGPLPYFPITNLHGMDIERYAALVARVTLWMGHRQMVELYGEAEPVLPLVALSGIITTDALRAQWPEVDVIVGNPPFLGSQLIRGNLGDAYVAWLEKAFGVGVKDLCVYWFRRAHDHLKVGRRAGLVGTNSISQNRGREASLQYIVEHGGVITDAVSSQQWPGEAKVHVSLVNWIKEPQVGPASYELDGEPVGGVTSSLRALGAGAEVAVVRPLGPNAGWCFQGPIPAGSGFIIAEQVAYDLLSDQSAAYSEVVRPYLTASDITEDPEQRPGRWIIDFNQMPLEQAMKFPRALRIVEDEVRPFRQTVRREGHRRNWWLFGEPRVGLRRQIAGLERYASVGIHGKRLLIAWTAIGTLGSNATDAIAFDDDYSMGILLSKAHDSWAWARSSTLETRLRYTPSSVFETFPWPDPTPAQRSSIAKASQILYARRSELCLEYSIGLTKLYNLMEDGAFADLAALHRTLDQAVVDAYGWPRAVAQDSEALVGLLSQRNREIADGVRLYDPFAFLRSDDEADRPPDWGARAH